MGDVSKDALEGIVVTEEQRLLADKLKKHLQAGQNYRSSLNLPELWAEYQRFWEGDQWPEATEETANYPRPVTNHFAEIIEMKTAGLTYEPPDVYFKQVLGKQKVKKIEVETVNEDDESFEIEPAELLHTMYEHVAEQIDLEDLMEGTTRSAALTGNGINYHYFDNSVLGGGKGASYVGEIRTMEIDISDFYPGNPREPSIQKQPFIIVTEQRALKEVKSEYEEFSSFTPYLKSDKIATSSQVYDHEKVNVDEDEIELIHYWEKKLIVEEDGDIKRRKFQVNYCVVAQNYVLREEKDYYKSTLYPFSGFAWYPRCKHFYGKSESADLINNQKELNRVQGIALLGAYKTGLANIRYKEGFVKVEDLPTGPGGVFIKDNTPIGQGWSVDYMNPPNIAPHIPYLKDALSQGMKDTSGVHEAWSGKAPSAHLNASAIMALQEAAGVRIKGIRRRMFASVREMGEIWKGYMMQYYKEDRLYRIFGKNNVEGTVWFKLPDFKDLEFETRVAVNNASPYSKTVIASTLEQMLTNKIIDGDLYLRMLPPEVFPKVTELLEMLEDRMAEQQQMVLQQQVAIVDEIVAQTIEQARAAGVPVTPESLQQMQQMIQSVAQEQQI
jgi:hypothetical protein